MGLLGGAGGRLHQPGVPTITSITQRSVPGVAVGISFPRVGISVLSAFPFILQPWGAVGALLLQPALPWGTAAVHQQGGTGDVGQDCRHWARTAAQRPARGAPSLPSLHICTREFQGSAPRSYSYPLKGPLLSQLAGICMFTLFRFHKDVPCKGRDCCSAELREGGQGKMLGPFS